MTWVVVFFECVLLMACEWSFVWQSIFGPKYCLSHHDIMIDLCFDLIRAVVMESHVTLNITQLWSDGNLGGSRFFTQINKQDFESLASWLHLLRPSF